MLPDPRLAYGEALFEFVLGTADGDTLSLEAVDLAGHVFDAVTLVRGDAAPPVDAPPGKR